MNRLDAKRIAETITNRELLEMFKDAKKNITDWTERSIINASISKGVAWNILAKNFDINYKYHILGKINMVREFGGYLPGQTKHIKKPIRKITEISHAEPNFDNYLEANK